MRLTELDSKGNLRILTRVPSNIFYEKNNQTTKYVFSQSIGKNYKEIVKKVFEIENFEDKLNVDINVLLKALIEGFYFKNNDLSNTFIKKNLIGSNNSICFSKWTTTLEEKNPIFNRTGYDAGPLPLFKIYLSLDSKTIDIYIWSIANGYAFYKSLDICDYGITWGLTENELL